MVNPQNVVSRRRTYSQTEKVLPSKETITAELGTCLLSGAIKTMMASGENTIGVCLLFSSGDMALQPTKQHQV